MICDHVMWYDWCVIVWPIITLTLILDSKNWKLKKINQKKIENKKENKKKLSSSFLDFDNEDVFSRQINLVYNNLKQSLQFKHNILQIENLQ